MKKKNVTGILALAMTMLLAGCGTQATDGQSSVSSVPKDGAEKTNEAAEAPVEEEPVEIKIFYHYDPSGETESSEFVVEELEKACNVKLIREAIPSSAYAERLQLAMADGDYPDAFIFDSHADSLLLSAIENGVVIPVNDLISDADNIQKYIGEGAFQAAKVMNDENIYLIPRCTVNRMDGYSVREDWLENLGIELDEDAGVTKEEFLNILERFTYGDPDGNGKDDTYGYYYMGNGGNLGPIFPGAFDCLGWQKSDGEFAYMDPSYEIGNENYKAVLEYSQQVYKYSHPDSVVTTDGDALVYAGQVGAKISFAGHVGIYDKKLKETNPDASLTYISGIRNDEGILHSASGNPGIWGGVAITSACKHPEKVVEIVNWFLSDQGWEYVVYGKPGHTYNKTADGAIEVIEENYKEEYTKNRSAWPAIVARRQKDISFFIDASLGEEEVESLSGWLTTAVEGVVLSQNMSKNPAISTDTEFIEAENKRKEVQTKIIMGVMDVSEYDKVLADWYEHGGRTYVEQMNEIIAQMQENQ